MADRSYVHLTVPAWAVPLVEALDDSHESYDESTIGTSVAWFGYAEVPGGQLELLPILEEAGVPYNQQYDAGIEYGPGVDMSRPDREEFNWESSTFANMVVEIASGGTPLLEGIAWLQRLREAWPRPLTEYTTPPPQFQPVLDRVRAENAAHKASPE